MLQINQEEAGVMAPVFSILQTVLRAEKPWTLSPIPIPCKGVMQLVCPAVLTFPNFVTLCLQTQKTAEEAVPGSLGGWWSPSPCSLRCLSLCGWWVTCGEGGAGVPCPPLACWSVTRRKKLGFSISYRRREPKGWQTPIGNAHTRLFFWIWCSRQFQKTNPRVKPSTWECLPAVQN